ncbi:MAG: DUF4199 family protein [Bacteroidales bacterium]|nr:DUF4199 family protein [Bacteroidales bacterium]
MSNNRTTWDHASKAGLALGGVSILYFTINSLTASSNILLAILNIGLWAAKFWFCIFLMKKFMQAFAAASPDADNARVFRFGVLTSLLSSLVYSSYYLAWVLFIQPDVFADALSTMSARMPAAAADQMSQMMDKMPQMTFFANLCYCFVFGVILAGILSRNIPSRDPFENYTEEDNQND